MGGNKAMSFSKTDQCYLPLEIELTFREKRKIGKRRNLANSALQKCVCPEVIENNRKNKKQRKPLQYILSLMVFQ